MKKYIICAAALCVGVLSANAQTAQTGLQTTQKGAKYELFTHNAGDKIKLNDVVTFHLVQKTDKDSVLASSYTMGQPAKIQVQDPATAQNLMVETMMEVLPMLTTGDSVLIKIPVDTLIKGHEESRPPFFPKGSSLNMYMKVVKVQSLNDAIAERNAGLAKVKEEETAAAAKYIADNKLTPVTTASGLKYIITQKSIKPKPQSGDTVFVNYTGKLLNGKVFDSSVESVAKAAGLQQPGRTYEPIKIALGQGMVIKGWDEGLLLVNEGGKATLIVPSDLAYGERGGGDAIPPFSTLVFDVEITKVKRVPHAAAAPAAKKAPVKKHYPATKKKS